MTYKEQLEEILYREDSVLSSEDVKLLLDVIVDEIVLPWNDTAILSPIKVKLKLHTSHSSLYKAGIIALMDYWDANGNAQSCGDGWHYIIIPKNEEIRERILNDNRWTV